MAEKPKKKTAKPKREAPDVMSSLSTQRPARIATGRSASARPAAPKTTAATTAAAAAAESATPKPKAAAKPKATAAKPRTAAAKPRTTAAAKQKAAAKRTAAAKPKAAASRTTAAAKPRATAARRKAAAPRTFEPTGAAESAAGSADEHAAGALPPLEREPRPRAIREGAPGMGTIGGDREEPSPEHGRPSGVELVTTAVQAAGELTQIGLRIGGRILKRAVDRLPRP